VTKLGAARNTNAYVHLAWPGRQHKRVRSAEALPLGNRVDLAGGHDVEVEVRPLVPGPSPERAQHANREHAIVLLVGFDDRPQKCLVPGRARQRAIDGENFRLFGPGEGFDFEMIDVGGGKFVLLSDFSALEELPAEFKPTPDGRIMLVIAGDAFGVKQ